MMYGQIPRAGRNALWALTLSAGGYSVITAYRTREERRHKTELSAKSVFRMGNLFSTTAVMSADYAYHFYFRRTSTKDHYESKKKTLKTLQNELEAYTLKLVAATALADPNQVEIESLKERIAATTFRMDVVASEMAMLLELDDEVYHRVHQKNAQRLTQMCATNGGLYIKLGQHIAMLDYLVPKEYQIELSTLLGSTPQSSFEAVRRVVKSELGKFPEELFDTFDQVPIASASLAQVHIATKDGCKYAVKIQHEGLASSSEFDMLVITKLVDFVSYLFKDFNYDWLSREMNRNLPLELDFQHEKQNIAKATAQLQNFITRGDVAIPKVNSDLSSKTVLTMSFEEGCYISNRRHVADMGLSKARIANLISNVFWEQIFTHGFVHCGKLQA